MATSSPGPGGSANAAGARGVKPGDRVAAQTEKSVAGLVLYLALPRRRGLSAAQHRLHAERARIFPRRCRAVAGGLRPVEGAKASRDRGQGRRQESRRWVPTARVADRRRAAGQAIRHRRRADDDLAAILYTSGTTGRSKGAMLTHDNLASNALTLVDYWRFTGDDVLLHALPIYHTHGLFVATNVTLLAGASMIFLPKFDRRPGHPADAARATTMMGVPTFYTRLLAEPGADARRDRAYAAVHFRLGAAAGRHPSRIRASAPATPSSSATA